MNVAEELAKIGALHESGALSDHEFAQAKAAVLAEAAAPRPTPASEKAAPPATAANSSLSGQMVTLLLLLVLGLAAWASNPDEESLRRTWEARVAEEVLVEEPNMLDQLAAKVLLENTYARQNYFFFSTAEITTGVRFGEPSRHAFAIGAFGYWWCSNSI